MALAIQELERKGDIEREDVREFLESGPFPRVEGRMVTIVLQGMADAVNLRHWIYGLPSSQPLSRIPGTDLWFLTLDLPEGSRMEYKLEVVSHGHSQLIRDPLNPHLAHDPYGANSVVHGAGYELPDWTQPDPEARNGTIEEFSIPSEAFGDERPVRLYVPARFREERRYPLLIVHDGTDFARFADLETVLDNLIHRNEIAPMVVAMVDPQQRLQEYADDERHGRFLATELVPHLEANYPIEEGASSRGLVGASFGAVAALSTAWRHPGFFGNLFLLSGSFAFTDIGDHDRGPLFDPVVDFVNSFRDNPGRPAERIYQCCGTYESLISYNRSMFPLLQSTGMEVRYNEARDGHDWENWRDRMREGLSWLYPGPLWVVYE
jgi:enterochelin esterase family protein